MLEDSGGSVKTALAMHYLSVDKVRADEKSAFSACGKEVKTGAPFRRQEG